MEANSNLSNIGQQTRGLLTNLIQFVFERAQENGHISFLDRDFAEEIDSYLTDKLSLVDRVCVVDRLRINLYPVVSVMIRLCAPGAFSPFYFGHLQNNTDMNILERKFYTAIVGMIYDQDRNSWNALEAKIKNI